MKKHLKYLVIQVFSFFSVSHYLCYIIEKAERQQSQRPKSKDWRIMLLIFFLSKTKKNYLGKSRYFIYELLFSLFSPSEIHNVPGATLVTGAYVANKKYSPKSPVRVRDLFHCVSQILSTPSEWIKNGIKRFWHLCNSEKIIWKVSRKEELRK